MSSFGWMSQMRQVPLLGAAVLLTVLPVSGQSSLSPNESSSSSSLVASLTSDGALFPVPAAAGAAAGGGGGRHGYFSSSKITGEAGGGFNAPFGNDSPFITWGGNFSAGGGLRLTHRVSVLAEYQFIDDKLPGAMVAAVGATGGNAHIWSLTLDPVIDLFPKRTNSIYLTGGGGFYRKLTSFTDPEAVEVCDPFYGCGIEEQNEVIGHYSSNQGGLNVGLGLTHRLGGIYGDGKAQVFAEARYLFVNSPRYTPVFSNPVGTTELLPVTVGLRF